MSTVIEAAPIPGALGGLALIVIVGVFAVIFATHKLDAASAGLPNVGSIALISGGLLLAVFIAAGVGIASMKHGAETASDELTSTLATRFEVTELAPMTDDILTCTEGSAAEGAQYTWVNKYGENAYGSIVKSAESGGYCEYELVTDGR